jgi:extradiol dioxygenase family protein
MSGIIAANRSALAAARAFYCDAMGGRQMRSTRHADGSGMLCFRVGGQLVTTGPSARQGPVALHVDDAVAIAERCWDAGFTVQVRQSVDASTMVVIDPFDLEIELVARRPASASARYARSSLRSPAAHPSLQRFTLRDG